MMASIVGDGAAGIGDCMVWAAGMLLMIMLAGCDAAPQTLGRLNFLASFQSRCEELPVGRMQVTSTPVTFTEDSNQSYRTLTRMKDAMGSSHRTVGLTQATLGYESTLESQGIADRRNGRVCARPTIDVVFAATPMTVYVAREFADDACRRTLIREHELKHVAVYREYLAEVVIDMRRELALAFGSELVFGKDAKESQESLRLKLHAFMEAFMQQRYAELRARQAEVDSPEEYARLTRCGPLQAE